MFFDQSLNHYDGRAGVWASICENPDADKPIWSDPVRLWHGAVLNKPTILANGNIILCNWGGHGHLRGQAQIIEVTPDKRVVWALNDWEHFSTPAHVQVAEDVPVAALRR